MGKIKIAVAFVGLLGVGVLFQNCAAAPPPDLGQTTQSSVSPVLVGVVNPTPTPTQPTTATPIPTTPTPIPTTPTPTPTTPTPVTQSYSWRAGAFGACDGSLKTRSVYCVNGTGTVVSDSNCNAGSRPMATTVCTLPYKCVATHKSINIIFGTYRVCTYSCTGPSVYKTRATRASDCRANPIGVAGTEIGWESDPNIKIARPFSRCTVKQALVYISSTEKRGESTCE